MKLRIQILISIVDHTSSNPSRDGLFVLADWYFPEVNFFFKTLLFLLNMFWMSQTGLLTKGR